MIQITPSDHSKMRYVVTPSTGTPSEILGRSQKRFNPSTSQFVVGDKQLPKRLFRNASPAKKSLLQRNYTDISFFSKKGFNSVVSKNGFEKENSSYTSNDNFVRRKFSPGKIITNALQNVSVHPQTTIPNLRTLIAKRLEERRELASGSLPKRESRERSTSPQGPKLDRLRAPFTYRNSLEKDFLKTCHSSAIKDSFLSLIMHGQFEQLKSTYEGGKYVQEAKAELKLANNVKMYNGEQIRKGQQVRLTEKTSNYIVN